VPHVPDCVTLPALWDRWRTSCSRQTVSSLTSRVMSTPDERGEWQRLVDHLQDRHGPGLRLGEAATLAYLSQMHERLHTSRNGAGTWPGGSEGPHKMDDITSWDETKRLRMHLNRTHRMDPVTYPESLAKLRDLHDQLHDGAYPHHSPEERRGHGQRNHHRTDLT
jgi:hypothetical protein